MPQPSRSRATLRVDRRTTRALAEATMIEPRSGPEAEERAYEEAMIADEASRRARAAEAAGPARSLAEQPSAPMLARQVAAPAAIGTSRPKRRPQDDDFSPFAAADEPTPRRAQPAAGRSFVVAADRRALAAAFWFLAPPEWKARVGLAPAAASPLALVTTHMDRQQLESGNELLTVTGRVINPTAKEQDVPPLQAQLQPRPARSSTAGRSRRPARTLAAGRERQLQQRRGQRAAGRRRADDHPRLAARLKLYSNSMSFAGWRRASRVRTMRVAELAARRRLSAGRSAGERRRRCGRLPAPERVARVGGAAARRCESATAAAARSTWRTRNARARQMVNKVLRMSPAMGRIGRPRRAIAPLLGALLGAAPCQWRRPFGCPLFS